MFSIIKINDIEEFSDIILIPDNVITEEIIKNVRNLNEKTELEPFIQDIIHDPNDTPHGPTEIADIIHHLTLKGNKLNVGIVLKGKSFKKVKSVDVAHQFLKLHQMPSLDLIILAAAGNIQGDTIRDFQQTAKDLDAYYLIIDAHDIARLLIAYEKICPKDGTPFTGDTCEKGHKKEDNLTISMEIKENLKYDILNLQDVSNALSKRYTAHVLIDRHYTKEMIREIILMANEEVKNEIFGINANKFWKDSPANVVNLYFAQDQKDIHHSNWVCRTTWVDPDKDNDLVVTESDETIDDIKIYWEPSYTSTRKVYELTALTKGKYLELCLPLLDEIIKIGNEMVAYFEDYGNGKLTEEAFLKKVKDYSEKTDKLSFRWGSSASPPSDCLEFDNISSSIFVSVDEMALFCADRDPIVWPSKSRDSMIKMYMDEFKRLNEKLENEKEKFGI